MTGNPAEPDDPAAASCYELVGADGLPYSSLVPGTLRGHRRQHTYGRLDCPHARRWLDRGHYARHRVFFADAAAARGAGYRPCAVCRPSSYAAWKHGSST